MFFFIFMMTQALIKTAMSHGQVPLSGSLTII
ncbi:hypothetical protein SPYJRS4_1510 [Streptococcus pyogenes JRS4]|nr:hypothetical protein SPYJRS4_1510 [Streptococcus pyogenes JRS4]